VTQVESYLRLHAYPILGNRPIGSVRRSEIQAWVKGRSEILAPTSVELVYRWVSTIFKAAVTDRVIASSPCVRIALPRRTSEEIVPLTIAQVEMLADAVPDRYRALVIFAAGMGMRQGECFGLTVDRVDFLRRQVTVDRQLIAVRARVPEFGPPKSQAGFRTIPMPKTVGAALAAHLTRYNPGTEGLIFTNSSGDPLQRSSGGDMWRRSVALAKLPKGTSFHDLRHFYASLLIAAGCSVKVIQKRLGHQSAVETLDTYGHLWPDSDDETRNAVDNIFAAIPTPAADDGRSLPPVTSATRQAPRARFL
jgi:integrase